ncbi:Fanconi anemia group A protein isoform X2 [Brienomyrus brachyistius]|uniref:Fanconi anemia group A protein isoform X2 n=1 Tax=Brienomyrus brachyistius TaxID=42636 RepID=UPI0020B2F087|nr:Fanconi anemia group A protein isoform X2 [Brienomyrus brachyistius]
MSLESSSVSVSGHRRSFSDLLAAHTAKRPRHQSEAELRGAAIQLLNRHQNLSALLLEGSTSVSEAQMDLDVENPAPRAHPSSRAGPPSDLEDSLIVHALQRQAVELGVPVGVVSSKVAAERVVDLMGRSTGCATGALLSSIQRAKLSALVRSIQGLRSKAAFSPHIFCRELWKCQPTLEVAWLLHSGNVVTLELILESEEGGVAWLGAEMRSLCGGAAVGVEEDKEVQQQVLAGVVSVLLQCGFQDPPGRISQLCVAVLEDMLSWVLDGLQQGADLHSGTEAAGSWVWVLDLTLCQVSLSDSVLRRFFTHCLTYVLTCQPQFKVSDAIANQSEWTFAKTTRPLTALYRKLAVPFSVDELLCHLRNVLETHEVNWQHVLSFVSTVLVCDAQAQRTLTELLSQLLSVAFESYDLENMVTAFLLARQGALEGAAVFPSYGEWFKASFGSAAGCYGNSKKSVVFLMKFLSDLVPFDPPQYLKVHILHPPYVPVKHRTLLQEYVSLAKTRLADLKVSVDEMGLYEDSSGADVPVQPGCQAPQDVEKAIRLFESSGKISPAVMEASIFRRQYFLTRFLPALLMPRVLPDSPDSQMSFIESLRRAEKIPASLYSAYTQSCERERLRREHGLEVLKDLQPQERLQAELQELGILLSAPGTEEEVLAQLARISESLALLIPERPDETPVQVTVCLHPDSLASPDLEHQRIADVVLRGFCQSLMDASRLRPPDRQGPWASRFVQMLLGHRKLTACLLQRLQGLICEQGATLEAAHLLGLAAFLMHLHECRARCPLVVPEPGWPPNPVPFSEALGASLPCSTATEMAFALRFCAASVCYALCRFTLPAENVQECFPSSLWKKLVYLLPRLLPGARADPLAGGVEVDDEAGQAAWRTITDPSASWESLVWRLWREPRVRALWMLPGGQLSFAEWLDAELGVQRSRDALTDLERIEYQQWACQQHYLPAPLEQGGCDGDLRRACSQILRSVLDLHSGSPGSRIPDTDTCLPDVVCRLQELMGELDLTPPSPESEDDNGTFLLDLVSQRCSATSDPPALSSQLDLERTLHNWGRVVVALPVTALLSVRTRPGRTSLDCSAFMEHVNQAHRNVCDSAGRLPYTLTAHFFKGALYASLRCKHPSHAVDELLTQLPQRCPLLLVSAGGWWSPLCSVLASLWTRLTGSRLPQEIQRLADCYSWACSTVRGEVVPPPTAEPLLLAAFLHHVGRGQGGDRAIRTTLGRLEKLQERRRPVRNPSEHHKHHVMQPDCWSSCSSSVLRTCLPSSSSPRRRTAPSKLRRPVWRFSATWRTPPIGCCSLSHPLQHEYQAVSMTTTDRNIRLMPLAFYSLVTNLDTDVLGKVTRSAGFLLPALHSYSALTKLFLDGLIPSPGQAPPLQAVAAAKQVLLKIISQSSVQSSSSQAQLEAACGELDPEVAAALSSHLLYHRHSDPLYGDLDYL